MPTEHLHFENFMPFGEEHLHFENFMPFCEETQECANLILPWTQTLDYNNTCLFEILLRHNKIGMIRLLLENNMDPNQRFGCEKSQRSKNFPGFLYKLDDNIYYKNVLGSLYLCMATARGNLDVVKLLLEKGATACYNTGDYGQKTTALMLSCLDKKHAGNNGHIEIFKLLLAQEHDEEWHREIAMGMRTAKKNDNDNIKNAFRNAVMCGYTEFVKSIIVSIPRYAHSILHESDIVHNAACNGFANIVEILLIYKFPVHNNVQTILHSVIESKTQQHHGHGIGYAVVDNSDKIATAKILFKWIEHCEAGSFYRNRLIIETTDQFGEKGTPFFYAVLTCVYRLPRVGSLREYADNVNMIKLLHEHHAYTDTKCIDNCSALKYILKFPQGMHLECPHKYKDIIVLLVKIGCAIDSIDAETLADHTDAIKWIFQDQWNKLGLSFKNTLSMRTKKSRLPELPQEIQDRIVANPILRII